MKLISPCTQENNREYFSSLGILNAQIEETYQGFLVVKSFNVEEDAIQRFKQVNTEMYEKGWKARFFGGIMMPAMQLLQNVIYVLIAAIGCIYVVSGVILIGNMQAFLQFSSQFSQPMQQFSQIWTNILSMVVIVGHTGAGKTTLINLMERFYEIDGGGVRIDGTDIRNTNRQALRKKIGMVLQDTWLFSGTIYDNIKYGNEDASEKDIDRAAKAAYADDFIQKLPDEYQTVLGEEASNLSQGQRQLITIARAFVSNPEILILDEATSNVDSRTELVI